MHKGPGHYRTWLPTLEVFITWAWSLISSLIWDSAWVLALWARWPERGRLNTQPQSNRWLTPPSSLTTWLMALPRTHPGGVCRYNSFSLFATSHLEHRDSAYIFFFLPQEVTVCLRILHLGPLLSFTSPLALLPLAPPSLPSL